MPNIHDDLRPEEVMYINAFKYTPKMRLNAAELEQAVFLTLKSRWKPPHRLPLTVRFGWMLLYRTRRV